MIMKKRHKTYPRAARALQILNVFVGYFNLLKPSGCVMHQHA